MSEFHVVEIDFQDEGCLLEALKEEGYKPEIHEEPVNLHGYRGDQRSQKAHIVIPKSQVGTASNDVGFLRLTDGKYKMIVSAYDQGSNWGKGKVDKLKQLYAKNVIVKQAKKSKYKIKSQEVQADGSIKIRVRVRE